MIAQRELLQRFTILATDVDVDLVPWGGLKAHQVKGLQESSFSTQGKGSIRRIHGQLKVMSSAEVFYKILSGACSPLGEAAMHPQMKVAEFRIENE